VSNPYEPDRPFVSVRFLAGFAAATAACALASLPLSGSVEAVLIASAAFFALAGLLVFASLVANGLVDRIGRLLSR
jgi:hypothetical protein